MLVTMGKEVLYCQDLSLVYLQCLVDIHTSLSLRRICSTVRLIFPNHLFQTFLTYFLLCAATVFKADPLNPASGKLYRDKTEGDSEATYILGI